MTILKSKKFQAAIAGLVVAILAEVGFDLDTQQVMVILSPILTYIAGQGLADVGKEKALVDNHFMFDKEDE